MKKTDEKTHTGLRTAIRVLIWLVPMLLLAGTGLAAGSAADELSFVWETDGCRLSITLTEKKDGSLTLFLPGSCDGLLRVRLNGSDSIRWQGQTMKNGDVQDFSRWIGTESEVFFPDTGKTFRIQIMRGSEIPALFFRISEDDLKRIHGNKNLDIRGDAALIMLDASGTAEVSDSLTSFHMHGNSTVFGQKKPYQFKLARKASLGGMGKGKTWMLLANWFDISLIRNQMTYDLCREMGLSGTPDCRQADVWINGAYNGTYLLTEKIQLKKDRLEITNMEDRLEELNGEALSGAARKASSGKPVNILHYFDVREPEDVTGGFLLEIEKALHFSQNKEDAGFVTDGRMCVVVKEPSQPGPEAVKYIAGLVNDFHNAVLSKNGINPATGKYYSEYMDMHSFAAKIIVEEFSANYDVRAGSQFLYKDSSLVDDKLYAGPGWDYDLTYGNKEDGVRNPLKKDFVYTRSNDTSQLYHYLLTHSDFTAYTRKVFEEELVPAGEILLGLREAPAGSQLKSIRTYRAEIRDSAAMNFTRWNAKTVADITDSSGRTFEDAGNYLEDWVRQRFGMLREYWLLPDPQ